MREGEVLVMIAGDVAAAESPPTPVPEPVWTVPLPLAPALPDDPMPPPRTAFAEPAAVAEEGSVPGTMLDEPKPFSERSADSNAGPDLVLVLELVLAPVDPREPRLFPVAVVPGARRFGAASRRA